LDDSRATLTDDFVEVLYAFGRSDTSSLCSIILAKFVPTLSPDAASVVTSYLDPISRATDSQNFAGHVASMCEDVRVCLRLCHP
jgi:hypothetical protein